MKGNMIYGIWCFDANNHRGDWLRESDQDADDIGILVWTSKRLAWSRAAGQYGYHSYTAAKRDGWVEVRPFTKSNGRQL